MLLGGFLLLASGCAFYSRHGSEALVGTWTNAMGTVWIVKADGTFDVDFDRDGKRDGWGKWTVDEDTVTFVRKGGVKPKASIVSRGRLKIRSNSHWCGTSASCGSRT